MKYVFLLVLFCSTTLFAQLGSVNVTSQTIKVPRNQLHEFMFGFSEGDLVTFKLNERKNKKINKVEIIDYSTGNLIYSEYKKPAVSYSFKAIKTGILLFRITNEAISKRICEVKINRIPKDDSTVNFNPTVFKRVVNDTTFSTTKSAVTRTQYKPKSLIDKETYYINSTSNEFWLGGKSKIIIQVTLPKNTAEWYYSFSAARDEKTINDISNQFSLVSDLSYLIDQSGLISIGVDMLNEPPGADYCDIYMLDHNNYLQFNNGQRFEYYINGSRKNLKSGVVKVNHLNNPLYLAIMNTDEFHGINVVLEVVAIIKNDITEMVEVKTPHVTSKEEFYLKQ